MARRHVKGPIWQERVQRVKRSQHVVRVFTGETDEDWNCFLNSLPEYSSVQVGPICPHYRTDDGKFHWASYDWPVDAPPFSPGLMLSSQRS